MYTEKEKLTPTNITEVMERAYIDYSMSVIISRAPPRCPRRPQARAAPHPLLDDPPGPLPQPLLTTSAPPSSGKCSVKYHPHGTAPSTIPSCAWRKTGSCALPLIDPQGNFGSVDGDPPSRLPVHRVSPHRPRRRTPSPARRKQPSNFSAQLKSKTRPSPPSSQPRPSQISLMNGSTWDCQLVHDDDSLIPPHNVRRTKSTGVPVHIIDNSNATVDVTSCPIIKGPDIPHRRGHPLVARDTIMLT